jgi:hypothetical protein
MDKKLSNPIDIIKNSSNIFFEKTNLISFLKIYSLLIPFQLFFLYQSYFIESQSKILNTGNAQDVIFKYPWFFVSIILVNLLFMIVSFWVELSGIHIITSVTNGRSKTTKEIFSASWKMIWPFSLLSILIGLIEVGGFILLIIPGVIFSLWYGFSKFVFVNEGKGVIDSLKKSKELVVGRFFPVLGRVIVFSVLIFLFQMAITLIPFSIGSVLVQLFGALFVLPFFLLYQELKG